METQKEEIKIDKSKIRRILIVRVAKIGDVIFSTPLVRAIKKGMPGSKITYIVNEYAAPALKNNPYIDNLLVSKGDIHKLLIKEEPYDLAINLHAMGNRPAAQLVYLSGAKYRIANIGRDRDLFEQFHNIRWNYSTRDNSMIGANMNILDLLGIKYADKETEIFLTREEKRKALDYLKKRTKKKALILGLHPACDIPRNHWKNKRWAGLADRLVKEYNAAILLFQSPDEAETAEKIKNYMKEDPIIIPPMDLRGYMGLVSQCDYFFTLDSGPMHIAQALGVPVIGLFIASSPRVFFDYEKGIAVTADLKIDYKKKIPERNLEIEDVLEHFSKVIKTQKGH